MTTRAKRSATSSGIEALVAGDRELDAAQKSCRRFVLPAHRGPPKHGVARAAQQRALGPGLLFTRCEAEDDTVRQVGYSGNIRRRCARF